jgi:hypothetical protein
LRLSVTKEIIVTDSHMPYYTANLNPRINRSAILRLTILDGVGKLQHKPLAEYWDLERKRTIRSRCTTSTNGATLEIVGNITALANKLLQKMKETNHYLAGHSHQWLVNI